MSTAPPLTVPPVEELRATIRARAEELRALRRLLRLAEATQAAGFGPRPAARTPAAVLSPAGEEAANAS
jgi:hypothetical protein